jgi:hypothetical protein
MKISCMPPALLIRQRDDAGVASIVPHSESARFKECRLRRVKVTLPEADLSPHEVGFSKIRCEVDAASDKPIGLGPLVTLRSRNGSPQQQVCRPALQVSFMRSASFGHGTGPSVPRRYLIIGE